MLYRHIRESERSVGRGKRSASLPTQYADPNDPFRVQRVWLVAKVLWLVSLKIALATNEVRGKDIIRLG